MHTDPKGFEQKTKTKFPSMESYLIAFQPDIPVYAFHEQTLIARHNKFHDSFPGDVTFAVKANADERVLKALLDNGMHAFDVASPVEIALMKSLKSDALLHYHNPVRSLDELAFARANDIRVMSVDRMSELIKIQNVFGTAPLEISVRFKLPIEGSAYNFGAKFGAEIPEAAGLLKAVRDMGYTPSLTFHPGTQCHSPAPFLAYLSACREIIRQAQVTPYRVNVGGGFPADRNHGASSDLDAYFDAIREKQDRFDTPVRLVCEPGRAMVADSFSLALRVKSLELGRSAFLNDGIYGTLPEFNEAGNVERMRVISPTGDVRREPPIETKTFGPTCDGVDTLKSPIAFPRDTKEGDYIIFEGMGAYVNGTNTRFNGYGARIDIDLEQQS